LSLTVAVDVRQLSLCNLLAQWPSSCSELDGWKVPGMPPFLTCQVLKQLDVGLASEHIIKWGSAGARQR
jgi:hypothetical protein